MSLRKEQRRIENDFSQAAGLLRHDLVWSNDLNIIRLDLATYLESRGPLGVANHASLIALVRKLISADNDLTI